MTSIWQPRVPSWPRAVVMAITLCFSALTAWFIAQNKPHRHLILSIQVILGISVSLVFASIDRKKVNNPQ